MQKLFQRLRSFWRRLRRRPTPICKDLPFGDIPITLQALEENPWIVARYSGVLPNAPRLRHVVLVVHLRQIHNRPGYVPFRANPRSTHEIFIWYQRRSSVEEKKLLFRCEFDAGSEGFAEAAKEHPHRRYLAVKFAGDRADECARFVAKFVARQLRSSGSGGVVRSRYSDEDWMLVVERAARSCNTEGEKTEAQHG